jgi:hypothetical protein
MQQLVATINCRFVESRFVTQFCRIPEMYDGLGNLYAAIDDDGFGFTKTMKV